MDLFFCENITRQKCLTKTALCHHQRATLLLNFDTCYTQCIFFRYAGHLNLHFRSLHCSKNWCTKTLCIGHRQRSTTGRREEEHTILATNGPHTAAIRQTVASDLLEKRFWDKRQVSCNSQLLIISDFTSPLFHCHANTFSLPLLYL